MGWSGVTRTNRNPSGGTRELFHLLGVLWGSRNTCRVLLALIQDAKTQRTLQRELGMKASLVCVAVSVLDEHELVRAWTDPARRDKLYTVTSRGLHVASLLEDFIERNQLGHTLGPVRGVESA